MSLKEANNIWIMAKKKKLVSRPTEKHNEFPNPKHIGPTAQEINWSCSLARK